MRLAVTGGGGFIGGAVARRLLECGFERQVRLFDRVFSQAPAFETVSLDLTDEDAPERIIADADCIIHLASLPGDAAEADPHASHRQT